MADLHQLSGSTGTNAEGGLRSCESCRSPTENPRFCSRSCAAKVNNRRSPKRRLEGACQKCSVAIAAKRTVCEVCSEAEKEARRKREAGLRTLKLIDGRTEERKIDRASTLRYTVFESTSSVHELAVSGNCGALIDRALAIVCNPPSYLRSVDAERHAAFLLDFRSFRYVSSHWTEPTRSRAVASLPIRSIGRGLRKWVESFRGRDAAPLYQTYAIDTAQLIDAYVCGRTFYRRVESDGWKISPLVSARQEEAEAILQPWRQAILDPAYKKEITQDLGRRLVVLKIPAGTSLKSQFRGDSWTVGGLMPIFEIQRCHLSSRVYDGTEMEFSDASVPEFYFEDEFCFRGRIFGVSSADGNLRLLEWNPLDLIDIRAAIEGLHPIECEVPISWIACTMFSKGDWRSPQWYTVSAW